MKLLKFGIPVFVLAGKEKGQEKEARSACSNSELFLGHGSFIDCTNGFNKGSKCHYVCNPGYEFVCSTKNQRSLFKCKCKGSDCKWKGQTGCCEPSDILCPEADAEIDFETGSILSFNDNRILPAYEKFFRDNGSFQCSKSAVLKISTEGIAEVMFDFYYKSAKPSGITFSIADTEKSNGNGGTDGLTPWHAEVQGRNGNMEIFMNSNDDVSLFEIMPEARPFLIENLTNIVASYAHLSLTVKPDYFGWNDNRHEDHNWELNREGFISSKYLFAMDGRTYIPNYGTGKEDKTLYLGMNQVVYPYDTGNIGMGLCRACITIRRKCNDAELEVDLTTGQTWGFPTSNVDWYRPLKKSSLVAGGCSMQGVLKFTTSTIKKMKMRFFYGDVEIAGTHMILADSPNGEGFGNDWANKYRAQIHAWNKELAQYVALHENWPNGVQGGHRLYTGTRMRNFYENGATYDITLEDRVFSYSNNDGHSGSKMNPWMFRMNNKKIKSEPLDEDIYLGLNRVPRDGKDGKNSGLCHVCIWID